MAHTTSHQMLSYYGSILLLYKKSLIYFGIDNYYVLFLFWEIYIIQKKQIIYYVIISHIKIKIGLENIL